MDYSDYSSNGLSVLPPRYIFVYEYAVNDFTETWDSINTDSRLQCMPVEKVDIIGTPPLVVCFNNHKKEVNEVEEVVSRYWWCRK